MDIVEVSPRDNLFLVFRSSDRLGKPCPEAFRVRIRNVDIRTVDSPNKLPHFLAIGWYIHGTNHRVENGFIKRDLGFLERWAVEIEPHDLKAFVKKYGQCIIGLDRLGFWELEIYDDYLAS